MDARQDHAQVALIHALHGSRRVIAGSPGHRFTRRFRRRFDVLGHDWSLSGVSRTLLYLIGVLGEVLVLASIYFVMPVGRLSWRHALIGGVSATVLWEISRHILVWYLATLSQVQTVYGSLTTAIVVLLSLELAAIVLLFGAQVIAEYERIEWEPVAKEPAALHTA